MQAALGAPRRGPAARTRLTRLDQQRACVLESQDQRRHRSARHTRSRLAGATVDFTFRKSDLAREIDKNPSSIRRLLTLSGSNPELRTVVAMANALDADLRLVPRSRQGRIRRPASSG
jgi:hypothetical protein